MFHPGIGQDSGWDGNDPEAQHHHHGSQQAPQGGLGHHIAITNGGHGHDCPIDPIGNRFELGLRRGAFDHENAVPQNDLQHEDKEEIDADRARTPSQGPAQHPGFVDEPQC